MMLRLFERIIWETFQWVALLGGVLGVVTGVTLVFNSAFMFRVSDKLNRWVSTRQALRPLEVSIEVERVVYRSHRFVGALLFVGALFTLYVMLARFKGPEMAFVLGKYFRVEVAAWLGKSLRIFLIAVNVVALAIAAAMILRPSSLKTLEAWANRTYSGRQATRMWELPRAGADAFVRAQPRLIGLALSAAGLFVVFVMGYVRFVGR
jgi:hypothetical protein